MKGLKEIGTDGISALADKLDEVVKQNKMLADRIKYLEEDKQT